jgi:16S rRNA (cytosine967-C5)-methyltransferase
MSGRGDTGRGGRYDRPRGGSRDGRGTADRRDGDHRSDGRRDPRPPVSRVPGVAARSLAWEALQRIEYDGAFANLLLPSMLDDAHLEDRDRHFVTELVYGTTRMWRACDHLVERFLMREPDPEIHTLLRLGAYQLSIAQMAQHAAVSATVECAPPRARGFVNAVLRNIARTEPDYPDLATELSYPDWIVDRLISELGDDDAVAALRCMNTPPPVHLREDGYVQDIASTWIADLVGAQPGERVLDLCAAPGGKATRIAATGATVIAADRAPHRAGLVVRNADRLQVPVSVAVADGTAAPFADGSFDRVLIDAPCSGLGALRRRPDARWRIEPRDIDELVVVQRALLAEGRRLVRPGGTLVWSVCTLTAAESIDHDHQDWSGIDAPGEPWRTIGRGARVLPHDADTDGMTVLRWQC